MKCEVIDLRLLQWNVGIDHQYLRLFYLRELCLLSQAVQGSIILLALLKVTNISSQNADKNPMAWDQAILEAKVLALFDLSICEENNCLIHKYYVFHNVPDSCPAASTCFEFLY